MDKYNYQLAKNESDMLDGNINRMFVTHDVEELNKMYYYAKRRLDKIYDMQKLRLIKGGDSE